MRHTLFLRRSPGASFSPRLRPRRHQSSHSKPDPAPHQNSQSQSQSQPLPPPSEPASIPSISTTSPPAVPARSGSRSLGQIIQASPIGRLGRSYSRVQDKRPYLTQVCSSIVVYLCGDLSAQLLFPTDNPARKSQEVESDQTGGTSGNVAVAEEEEVEGGGYDPWRTLRHLAVGVGSSIPSYNWFMFLHRNFNFASRFLSIVTKVVVQQIVFTPVFNTYFFSVHSLLSGASLVETLERLKVALPVSIVNSCKLWPAVTAFNFMYVAPEFRSVFSGCIAVGWQAYLSWLNQKAAREVEVELAEPALSHVGVDSVVAIKA